VPELSLRVDKPAHGGFCVGRADGRVIFCRHSLPGELVRAEVEDAVENRRFWRAEAVEVVADPNPDRVGSPCPWFGPGLCGGCSWLHATPDLQLRLKAQDLAETLERIGGVTGAPPTVGSLGMHRGWRTRMTLHTDERGRAGFHSTRSHDLVAVGDCLQAHPDLDLPEVLERQWPRRARLHVSVSGAGRAVLVHSPTQRSAEGPAEHVHEVSGRSFRCAVDGFWQSHVLAAQTLVDHVHDLVGPATGATLVDLYSGVGLFGLSMLADVDRVELVEGHRVAARFARANAADDPRVTVVARDVKRWVHKPVQADIVVLDPPRAGAGRAVVAGVAATGAGVVVYVSCEPSTLARDLAHFRELGYLCDRIDAFDVFPGTAHIETVVRLRRS
jgi:tRNA/tmRNA/rRNA uracil-C5-methylase (TrmA/RlmC/RlmD family)